MKDLAQKVIYNFEDSDNVLIKTLSEEDQIELIKEIVKIFRTWKKEDCVKSKFLLNKNFNKLSKDSHILFFLLLKNDFRKYCENRNTTNDFYWINFIPIKYPKLGKQLMKYFRKNEIENDKWWNGTLYKQFQEKYLKDFE